MKIGHCMRKNNDMKKFKINDYRNILLIVFLVLLYVVLSTHFFEYLYGSCVDWDVQHYLIPDYFRKLFYKTGNLFPSFAFNLGNGQNIYNLSYYGFLSPIILLSYFVPNIKMIDYIQITSILNVIVSAILMYKWIFNKHNSRLALICSLLFVTISPILFHSHRHIMFVSYMPFLILALKNTENYFENGKPFSLIICTFLIIMCNYFYSVSALFVIALYGFCIVFSNFRKNDFKFLLVKYVKYLFVLFVGILLASLIIVPTFYVLLSGRAKSTVDINLLSLFVPNFSISDLFYNPYSCGMTVLLFTAIIYCIINGDKTKKMLSTFLIIVFLFPIFSFLLNGTMYVDNKVFIPFVPLLIMLVSYFLDELLLDRISKKNFFIIVILLLAFGVINLFDEMSILYFSELFLVLFMMILNKKWKGFAFLSLSIIIIVSFCGGLFGDELYSKEDLNNMHAVDSTVLDEILKNDDEIHRVAYQNFVLHNINRVVSLDYYLSSIYSSVSNVDYMKYYYDYSGAEISQRSYAKISSSRNIFYNLKNSNKYLISSNDNVPVGYSRVSDDDNLYVNNDVLPIIYGSSNVIPRRLAEKTIFPFYMFYDLNSVIVDYENNEEYNETNVIKEFMGKIDIDDIKSGQNVLIENNDDKIIIDVKENATIVANVSGLNKNDIFMLSFDLENNNLCENGDLKIEINGIKNVLTCKDWKYHNRNKNFKYVISSNNTIDKLNIKISKGRYVISNIKKYYVNYSDIIGYKNNVSNFVFDTENTIGDTITGKISLKDDGYIATTIPYDSGFSIFLNGNKVGYEKINNGFIGVKVKKGTYDVKIKYKSPYLDTGLLLSSFGIFAFACIGCARFKKTIKKK